MSNIQLHNESTQSLNEVSFLKQNQNSLKIRDTDSNELSKSLSHWIAETAFSLGIKDAISDFNKKDVITLILSEHKGLSIDELYYAFKMDRYGKYEPISKGEPVITKHFQLFGAEYVSTVLSKYKTWKRKTKIHHNISVKEQVVLASEEERVYWERKAVISCLMFFKKNRTIENGKHYVYDILNDEGVISPSPQEKINAHARAVDILHRDLTSKKAKSSKEKKEIEASLQAIRKPNTNKTILKAKELILFKFFSELTSDKDKLVNFKEKFKIVE